MSNTADLIRKEIERLTEEVPRGAGTITTIGHGMLTAYSNVLSFLDTLQEPSLPPDVDEAAEEYSFNIQSELFLQLTLEQQKLWKKEIEQAYRAGVVYRDAQIPKLPNDINKAARRFAIPPYMKDIDEDYLEEYPYDKMAEIAFKAGAAYEAGKGVEAEAEVCKLADRSWVTPINEKKFHQDVYDNFKAGDKVIVKIIKYENTEKAD